MAKLLTDDIIIEKLNEDGFMQEPDGPWILEYINEHHGGKLDTTSDYIDNNYTLKIYSESTADCYDIYWCTHEERPYISQDGYYYEDYAEWSTQAVEQLAHGDDVWVDPHLWSDMEYEFNHELEQWWQDVYDELFEEKKQELLETEDYYEEEE